MPRASLPKLLRSNVRDTVRGVAERLANGARLVAIEAVADGVLNSREVVMLDKTGAGGESLCTTRSFSRSRLTYLPWPTRGRPQGSR